MSHQTDDTWFYTFEGQKVGPIPFSELRERAYGGNLNPRLDMVWSSGMAEWKPSGEVDGLFERRFTADDGQSIGSPESPYQSPSTDPVAELLAHEVEWPGATRASFLLATIVFPVVWQIGLAFSESFASASFGPEVTGYILIGAAFVPLIVGIYFNLLRFVNLGMSRWWYLGNFVPLLNFWLGYRCFACPAGYAFHKKLDGIGIVIAIFYCLIIVAMLVAVASVVALFAGTIGDPEVKRQFEEILRSIQSQSTAP